MPLILGTNSIKDTGFKVANSCRFDGSSSYLTSGSFGTATSGTTWTFSLWIKRSEISAVNYICGSYDGSRTNSLDLVYDAADTLSFYHGSNDGNGKLVKPARLFRDPSAWTHIVWSVDTTQGTAANRVKVYFNGVEDAKATATYPDEDAVAKLFADTNNKIGSQWNGTTGTIFDGYMAEVVFIDGQALTPTSFGEYDEDSPTIWKPIDVSGLTFGNNGFYLDFEDSSALGNDVSGNNNDFTVSGLAATDQSTDTPTNNFATLNSLIDKGITYSEGNLQYKNTHGSNSEYTHPTIQEVSNGRWYWEIKMASTNNNSAYEYFGNGTAYVKSNGDIHPSGTTTVSNGDIFGFYLNYEDGQMTIHRNGSQVYQSSSGISLSTTTAQIAAFNNTEYQLNFGNPIFSISSGNADANGYGNFEYSPVLSGVNFYSLCTKNLAEYG